MASSKGTPAMLVLSLLISVGLLLIFFPPKTPRVFLNQRRAVESIRNLSRAEQDYAGEHPETGFACNLSNLGNLVDRVLASGTKSAYHFEIECPASRNQKAAAYTITAVPTNPGTTGVYALCTDQRGEVWYSENGLTSDCLAMRKPIEKKYR